MGSATEIAPGLRRWTARHGEWNEDVGSVAAETRDGLVFIDPIAPPAELGRPDHVLVTVYWHGRDTGALGRARCGRRRARRSRCATGRSR